MEKHTHEIRTILDVTELRILGGDKPRTLAGYAAVFNSPSADLGGFKEQINPGAFKRSIGSGADIRALVDHDPTKILGRSSAGTLRMAEDARGLLVEVDVPATTYANDLLESVKRGDIKGMSFGFRTPKGGDQFVRTAGQTMRFLNDVDLKEVTFTSIPAYDATSCALRVDPSAIEQARAVVADFPIFKAKQNALRVALAQG